MISELQLTDRDDRSTSQVEINTRRSRHRFPTKALGRDTELSNPMDELNEDEDITNFDAPSPSPMDTGRLTGARRSDAQDSNFIDRIRRVGPKINKQKDLQAMAEEQILNRNLNNGKFGSVILPIRSQYNSGVENMSIDEGEIEDRGTHALFPERTAFHLNNS